MGYAKSVIMKGKSKSVAKPSRANGIKREAKSKRATKYEQKIVSGC